MSKSITFLDTTLRDGVQGIGVQFSLDDKLDLTKRLDEFGIDYIEGGFPLASEREQEYFRRAGQLSLQHSKLTAFGSTRYPGAKAEQDKNLQALLRAGTAAVVIVCKGWDAHVQKVLRTDLEENLRMISDSVGLLKRHNIEVIVDIEHFFDGYLHNPEYAQRVLRCAGDAGSDWLVLCDTNGGLLPHQVPRILGALPQNLPPLGIHCHNDTETAVACSLFAAEAGIRQIHGTINGIGERCGNTNLCSIIPNLLLKAGYEAQCEPHLVGLTSLANYVYEKANLIPNRKNAYVGIDAFGHKAGQHADVVLKESSLMEHISSDLVGNARRLVVSEMAGRASLLPILSEFGEFSKDSPEVRQILKIIKTKESQGYSYENAGASLELLIRQILGRYRPLFLLDHYHVEIFRTQNASIQSVGRIFIVFPIPETTPSDWERQIQTPMRVMGAGVGNGPIEALNNSIRNALSQADGRLSSFSAITLSDYRVRVIDPEQAASAKVRVTVTHTSEHHSDTWNTTGVSDNIIEASFSALKDAYEYAFNRHCPDA